MLTTLFSQIDNDMKTMNLENHQFMETSRITVCKRKSTFNFMERASPGETYEWNISHTNIQLQIYFKQNNSG